MLDSNQQHPYCTVLYKRERRRVKCLGRNGVFLWLPFSLVLVCLLPSHGLNYCSRTRPFLHHHRHLACLTAYSVPSRSGHLSCSLAYSHARKCLASTRRVKEIDEPRLDCKRIFHDSLFCSVVVRAFFPFLCSTTVINSYRSLIHKRERRRMDCLIARSLSWLPFSLVTSSSTHYCSRHVRFYIIIVSTESTVGTSESIVVGEMSTELQNDSQPRLSSCHSSSLLFPRQCLPFASASILACKIYQLCSPFSLASRFDRT